jgi:hypothetical protein
MSYGFYKMPPGSSFEDYIIKVAGRTPIAIGSSFTVLDNGPVNEIRNDRTRETVISQGKEVVDNTPNIPGDDVGVILEPPKVHETLLSSPMTQGYSGDVCDNCQGSRLRWAGHCKVCDDCGTTTGCS